MHRSRLPQIASLLLVVSSIASAAIGGRVYRNAALRVQQLELPRGWDLTPATQLAYPRVLLLASSGVARMTFTVERVEVGAPAERLAQTARALLERQGFRDLGVSRDGDRARLEATFDGGRRLLRQAYVVDGDLAFVLSITLPADRRERSLRDFDDTLRSLVITPASAASPSPASLPPATAPSVAAPPAPAAGSPPSSAPPPDATPSR